MRELQRRRRADQHAAVSVGLRRQRDLRAVAEVVRDIVADEDELLVGRRDHDAVPRRERLRARRRSHVLVLHLRRAAAVDREHRDRAAQRDREPRVVGEREHRAPIGRLPRDLVAGPQIDDDRGRRVGAIGGGDVREVAAARRHGDRAVDVGAGIEPPAPRERVVAHRDRARARPRGVVVAGDLQDRDRAGGRRADRDEALARIDREPRADLAVAAVQRERLIGAPGEQPAADLAHAGDRGIRRDRRRARDHAALAIEVRDREAAGVVADRDREATAIARERDGAAGAQLDDDRLARAVERRPQPHAVAVVDRERGVDLGRDRDGLDRAARRCVDGRTRRRRWRGWRGLRRWRFHERGCADRRDLRAAAPAARGDHHRQRGYSAHTGTADSTRSVAGLSHKPNCQPQPLASCLPVAVSTTPGPRSSRSRPRGRPA